MRDSNSRPTDYQFPVSSLQVGNVGLETRSREAATSARALMVEFGLLLVASQVLDMGSNCPPAGNSREGSHHELLFGRMVIQIENPARRRGSVFANARDMI